MYHINPRDPANSNVLQYTIVYVFGRQVLAKRMTRGRFVIRTRFAFNCTAESSRSSLVCKRSIRGKMSRVGVASVSCPLSNESSSDWFPGISGLSNEKSADVGRVTSGVMKLASRRKTASLFREKDKGFGERIIRVGEWREKKRGRGGEDGITRRPWRKRTRRMQEGVRWNGNRRWEWEWEWGIGWERP